MIGLLLLLAGSLLPSQAHAASAASRAQQKTHQRLSPKERARIRRQLIQKLRRNPAYAFSKDFLRKANLVEFQLPLSVRLSKSDGQGGYAASDDQLQITWDDSVFAWPLAGGVPAPPQTVFLTGGFTMDAIFHGGDTSGYGELGAAETILGRQITMKSDPFRISDFTPACASGPQLATDPNTKVTLTNSEARYGLLNLFSGQVQGTLSLRMTFASSIAASCGAAPALSANVDNTSALPMPVRFDGKFAISPAITPDGKMRFGKITVDDATNPQLSTFAYVRACTQPTVDPTTCVPQQFPARLKFKTLTAEVLLGDIFP